MKDKKTILLIAVPAIIIVLALVFITVVRGEFGFSSRAGVKFNNLSVSEDDMDADLKAIAKNKGLVDSLKDTGTPLIVDGEVSPTYRASWANIQLQILSIREAREAKKMKITDADRKEAEEDAKSLFGNPDADESEKIWKAFPESFRKRLIEGFAEQSALLRAAKEVTDKEVDDFFEENKETFTTCDSGKVVSHILVETKEEAEKIKSQINEGTDFAKLAKDNSTDPGSAANGGELGCYTEGQFVEAFDNVAKSLANGAISEIIQTEFGFHIIRADAFEAPTADDVRDEIIAQLEPEKQRPLFEDVEKRLKNSKVSVLKKYGQVERDENGVPSIVPLQEETSTTSSNSESTTSTIKP